MPRIKKDGKIHDTLTGYEFSDGNDQPLRPLKAMRMKCLECCCNQPSEVKRCHISDCTLWPYRHGKSPNRKRVGGANTEALQKAREKARAAQKALEQSSVS